MNFNLLKSTISVGVSALISYGFYIFHESNTKIYLVVGSFIFLSLSLMLSLAVSFEESRTTGMIRTAAALFFVIAFLSNLLFTLMGFSPETYVIVNGVLFLIFILIVYSIARAKK